ncbi:MarR family transcriptional regulator, partial [Jatrophihabitans sp.]|uniref:MarR family transcriptional regulator n=1 Tax=Jatrophihabitans sp. TaxID=1932789 RepID=UPI002EE61647
MWITVLEENGVAVLPIDREHVRLTDDDHSEIFFVLTIPRVARTRDIKPAPERDALLVAHSITVEALERAWAAGWSVVTDEGTGKLRLAQRTLRLGSAGPAQAPRRSPGRPGRGVFSVVRVLFALEGRARQDEIAEFARVGQAAVSKALNRLVDRGLVVRGEHGWEVADRAGAISWWLGHYPGPGGIETHW